MLASPATGALYGVGRFVPFLVRTICEAVFLMELRRIPNDLGPTPRPPRLAWRRHVGGLISSYRDGFRYINADRLLRTVAICAPLVNLMVFTGSTWTIYYLRSEGESALTTGLVQGGFAVGLLLGGVFGPKLSDRVPAGWLATVGLIWMACMYVGFFLSSGHIIAMTIWAALTMLLSPALNGSLFGHVFSRTDSAHQGRIFALFAVSSDGASMLAPVLTAGFVVHQATMWMTIGVCGLAAVGITLLLSNKDIRHLPVL